MTIYHVFVIASCSSIVTGHQGDHQRVHFCGLLNTLANGQQGSIGADRSAKSFQTNLSTRRSTPTKPPQLAIGRVGSDSCKCHHHHHLFVPPHTHHTKRKNTAVEHSTNTVTYIIYLRSYLLNFCILLGLYRTRLGRVRSRVWSRLFWVRSSQVTKE